MSTLLPHQQRVVDEETELDKKIDSLSAFFANQMFQTLPEAERDLLKRQHAAMETYSSILGDRIAAFAA